MDTKCQGRMLETSKFIGFIIILWFHDNLDFKLKKYSVMDKCSRLLLQTWSRFDLFCSFFLSNSSIGKVSRRVWDGVCELKNTFQTLCDIF